ncbi:MAG: twin-arginine translocase subunit TatC [Deltaproteobacteria bacterium]|nr:twin-arginine translocase subunit TatC [Deltaproteobacteria bacterium]
MSEPTDATEPQLTADERRMPFLEHLAELRDRLRYAVIAIVLAAVGCYLFRGWLFQVMARPLLTAFKVAKEKGVAGQLIFTSPIEAFLVLLKTALVSAIFVASPVIFYQLWAFIAPGLYSHEKRWALPFVMVSVLLFAGGGLFCYYFVLPPGYEFFLTAATDASVQLMKNIGTDIQIQDAVQIRPLISMEEYFGLTLMLLLVFGVVFELPLVLSVLAMLGIVSAKSLWRFNRYAILIFAIAGAVLTPGDLVIGQLAMAGSLTVLYNLSICIAWLVERKRSAADQESADPTEPTEHSLTRVE